MHEISLEKYNLRTDLIVDEKDDSVVTNIKNISNIKIEESKVAKDGNFKKGNYKTITFTDISDKDNYKNVLQVFKDSFKDLLKINKIKEEATCLIVGLGNIKSTPDSLGPLVLENILVTKHLFSFGEVENGYRNVSILKPDVTGTTGIETSSLIKGVVDVVRPDFLIVIDALASSSIERVNKTIQMSDSGIKPGSGVGNSRLEIFSSTYHIPVLAIGVPTIVDAATIVSDTINYMYKQISYKMNNINNPKNKLLINNDFNYLKESTTLDNNSKEELLGLIGTLNDKDFKKLIEEVLSPINYNLMVTPKDIDFTIEKLALLIAQGLNLSLHENYKPTK